MSLNTTQKAAVAAIKQQQKKDGSILVLGIAEELVKICEKEPESAQRVLDALTGGKPLRAAAVEMRKRAKENGIEYNEVEGILREIYGLDEPLETTEEADEDELV